MLSMPFRMQTNHRRTIVTDQYTVKNPVTAYERIEPPKQHQPEPGLDAELTPRPTLVKTRTAVPAGSGAEGNRHRRGLRHRRRHCHRLRTRGSRRRALTPAGGGIAVVDAGGNLKAHARMDGANIGSITIAINKAYTSIAFQCETGDLQEATRRRAPSTASVTPTAAGWWSSPAASRCCGKGTSWARLGCPPGRLSRTRKLRKRGPGLTEVRFGRGHCSVSKETFRFSSGEHKPEEALASSCEAVPGPSGPAF